MAGETQGRRPSDSNEVMKLRPEGLKSAKSVKEWNLKVHIVHGLAATIRTKKDLRQRLEKAGLVPSGKWTKDQEEFWKNCFAELCYLHPKRHGSYELKDEVWARIAPDKYPYNSSADMAKAKKRMSEKLHQLRIEPLQDEEVDLESSSHEESIPRVALKRSSSDLATEEPERKKRNLVEETPKITAKDVKTKYCKVCKTTNPFTDEFFHWKYEDQQLWVACKACLKRANPNISFSDHTSQASDTDVDTNGQSSRYFPKSTKLTEKSPEPTKTTEESKDSLEQENFRLMKENETLKSEIQALRNDVVASSATLNQLQAVNDSLQTEIESLTEENLTADAEIEGLRVIERRHNTMRAFGS